MTTSQTQILNLTPLVEKLKSLEGFSSTPYKCPAGVLTIGYGHTFPHGNVELSRQEAEQLLRSDLHKVVDEVQKDFPNLHPHQTLAVSSLAFNIGMGKFRGYKLHGIIARYDGSMRDALVREWSNICYAGGKRLKGLESRRQWELHLFLNGFD